MQVFEYSQAVCCQVLDDGMRQALLQQQLLGGVLLHTDADNGCMSCKLA